MGLRNLLKSFGTIFLLCVLALGISACAENKPDDFPEAESYTVQYTAGNNGRIAGNTVQTVLAGEDAETVIAVPTKGWLFKKWSDGMTEATRTDKSVSADISVMAIFEKTKCTVEYIASEYGKIIGETQQQVAYMEYGTKVTAVPDVGCRFIGWSDGETQVSREDSFIDSDVNLIAYFERCYTAGAGTKEDPFLINSYLEFQNMSYFPTAYFRLMCNLDLSGYCHEPIFSKETEFLGHFDGNGYTIKNATISTKQNFPSLFGFIGETGLVENFSFTDFYIRTFNFNTTIQQESYCVGGIAGVSKGLLNNILVSGEIHADGLYYEGVTIGGLVGSDYGAIKNCHCDINMVINDIRQNERAALWAPFRFGGLAGQISSNGIFESSVVGSISILNQTINKFDDILVGGLVAYGSTTNMQPQCNISDCSTEVDLTSVKPSGFAGGLIGVFLGNSSHSVNIQSCVVKTKIRTSYAGGLIGKLQHIGQAVVEHCCVYGDINAYVQSAGFVYNSMYGIFKDCFVTGTVKITDVSGSMIGLAAGFCCSGYRLQVEHCYSNCMVEAKYAGGFINNASHSVLKECYAVGKIRLGRRGGGFAHMANYSNMIDCYSLSNIIIAQLSVEQPSIVDSGTLLIGGFAGSAIGLTLGNCYWAGMCIYGDEAVPSPKKVVGGLFLGSVRDSEIKNCHVLSEENEVLSQSIGRNDDENPSTIELTQYHYAAEMFFLAERLNAGRDTDRWINIEGDFPRLKFWQ
ncbi:MAG: hypothetical protein HFE26_01630 [Clostridia bacterium]|nr:hypothetical protein [Clostridia bacterium]